MRTNIIKPIIFASLGMCLLIAKPEASTSPIDNLYVQGFAGYASNNFNSMFTSDELNNMSIAKGSLTYGVAFGYQFNTMWRADINYTGNSKNKVTLINTVLPTVTGSTAKIATATTVGTTGGGTINFLMLNGYFDFADVNYGLAPYATLGIGYGLIGNIQDFKVGSDPTNSAYIGVNTRVNSMHKLAYQFGGGILYKYDNHFILDANLKYTRVATNNVSGFNGIKYNNIAFQIGVRYHL